MYIYNTYKIKGEDDFIVEDGKWRNCQDKKRRFSYSI